MDVFSLFAEMDPISIITLVFGCLTVVGAGGGSYLAARIALAQLTSKVDALSEWLKKVDSGDTKAIGKIESKLEGHDEKLADHNARLMYLEGEHARFRPQCEARRTGEQGK